jgi:beta-galactosidase
MNRSPFLHPDRRQLLLGTAGAAGLVLAGPGPVAAAGPVAALKVGRGQPFDLGWRFQRGEGTGFEAPGFDDGAWRRVDLPHDWSIEDLPPAPGRDPADLKGPFDRKAEGKTATGFAVGGEGWYRKRFHLASAPPGRVEVLFEGVYMNSEVWLNGHRLGAHANGYTPFAYDLTPYLSPTGENVLAVRVRNLGRNSRWYSGSGIYRHVWLDVLPEAARIQRWGVGVVTQALGDAGARIEIGTRLDDLSPGLTIVSRVRDDHGRIVWEATAPAVADLRQTLTLGRPRLWSPEAPNLYVLETELRRGATVLDRTETPFGVRIVAFDAARGMTLNGAPIKLRGGCIHHDNGLLGAAAYDAAEARKVALLKARGYNALRPSHNLFSPAFLAACDRQGVMVIEETFDTWRKPKVPQDYSIAFDADWKTDLAAIVLSVRNHPSVVMYSIGNEIPGRNSPEGVELQWRLANEVHRLDPTRPVTAAINSFPGPLVTPSTETARAGAGGVTDHAAAVFLDVVGYNYKLADYEADHAQAPQRVFFGTESLPADVFAIWDLTDRSPWLVGDFVWTAMDYLGEAGIGGSNLAPATMNKTMAGLMPTGWPWVNAFCGDIDLIGNRKAPAFARDVVWGLSPLEIAVQRPPPEGKVDVPRHWGWPDELQSWTWPGAEGKPLTVRVYTSGDRVELRLNGVAVATKRVTAADLKRVELQVPYAPGVLEAVAFRGGGEIGRRQLVTTGAPAAVRLRPERPTGGAGRGDVSFVAVEILDAQGRIVPDLARDVRLSIAGPAELAGFGSANPLAVGGFGAAVAQTWNGRALAVLRGAGRPGRVRLQALSPGLAPGSADVLLA